MSIPTFFLRNNGNFIWFISRRRTWFVIVTHFVSFSLQSLEILNERIAFESMNKLLLWIYILPDLFLICSFPFLFCNNVFNFFYIKNSRWCFITMNKQWIFFFRNLSLFNAAFYAFHSDSSCSNHCVDISFAIYWVDISIATVFCRVFFIHKSLVNNFCTNYKNNNSYFTVNIILSLDSLLIWRKLTNKHHKVIGTSPILKWTVCV